MRKYWTAEDWRSLQEAQTYGDLLKIAFVVAKRMPQPLGQVCGPISTGGRGSIAENMRAINESIEKLNNDGIHIFDQIPFEDPMRRIRTSLVNRYPAQLLEEFYLALFESGLIKTLYFLPGWKSSMGATWEHEQAKRLGINIIYL